MFTQYSTIRERVTSKIAMIFLVNSTTSETPPRQLTEEFVSTSWVVEEEAPLEWD